MPDPSARTPSDSRPEVVLVNPHGWRFIGDGTVPSGLLAVAAPLTERYRVTLIDQRVEKHWRRRLDEALTRAPLAVGVTTMTGKQIRDALTVARLVRERGKTPIVAGGVHPSLLPAQTLEHPDLDFVVQGEGEETFLELCEALAEGRGVAGVRGLWHKLDGRPATAGARPPLPAADLPRLPYQLLDLDRYVRTIRFGRTLSVFSSRGCPFRCSFCYNVAFFGAARWKPLDPDRVADETAELVQRLALDHVQFLDDNFFVSRDRVAAIAEALHARLPRLQWSVLGAHVQNLRRWDVASLVRLRACGLREVLVGAESGAQRVLDAIRKDYRVEDLFAVNRRLAEADIEPTYSFMSGIPDETDEELRATIRAMLRLEVEHPGATVGNIKPFLPYPGTELYDVASARGFVPPSNLAEWGDFASYNYGGVKVGWLSSAERYRLLWLYYGTVLLSPDYLFLRSVLFRWVARLVAPLMRRRVERFDFRWSVVPRLMRFVQAHVL
ncbi:MAG: B12-binding domain-containing radical SAM protein [Deltaproteobacteria bacterium]|nr:B12-binding domain-containing radical SAM protein [Deltaproteobacteria bacterium]